MAENAWSPFAEKGWQCIAENRWLCIAESAWPCLPKTRGYITLKDDTIQAQNVTLQKFNGHPVACAQPSVAANARCLSAISARKTTGAYKTLTALPPKI